jgi:hypothetical protein
MLSSRPPARSRDDSGRAGGRPSGHAPTRRVVAAFKCRAHAERAIGALLDTGFELGQIELEGPAVLVGEAPPVIASADRARGTDAVACGVLLGLAVLGAAPSAGRAWVRGTLAVPALGLSVLAALTALGNPDGVELYPWTVVVASRDGTPVAGGLLRAFGGRGVHLN